MNFEGEFLAFDYGTRKNMQVYGSKNPYRYDLRLVTAPVYIFWSKSDLYVDQKVQKFHFKSSKYLTINK